MSNCDRISIVLSRYCFENSQGMLQFPEPLAVEVIDRALLDNPKIIFKRAKQFQQALFSTIDRL